MSTRADSVVGPESARVRELPWRRQVVDVVRQWAPDAPLAAIVSGGEPGRWSRWSILAAPSRVLTLPLGSASDRLEAAIADARFQAAGLNALPPGFPFVGGWIGWISYDMGRELEPTAQRSGAVADRQWPGATLCRCDGALVHDAIHDRWWSVGDERAIPELADPSRGGASPDAATIGPFASGSGREAYVRSVERALQLIAAGDVFQVNLAHRLSARFSGSPRELAARMLTSAAPRYGAWIESWQDRELCSAVLSLSPELFMDVDLTTRQVVTRPIKGTRPAGAAALELAASAKDRAELNMIVDLMRNDLGRVCEYGSVRVESAQDIEAHAGVIHGVATICGQAREGAGHADLLRAMFPPGSVTGAPKVRAMQIIDELEPVRRGPYCGSVGFVSDHGRACWNVAIRTAALTLEPGATAQAARGVIDYSVGAGIVADSDPGAEWEETLSKAQLLRSLEGGGV